MKKNLPLIILGNLIPLGAWILFGWTAREVLLFYIFEFVFAEIVTAVQIGVLVYSNERKITSPAASFFAVVLVLVVHTALFLFILVLLSAISTLATPGAETDFSVKNPVVPFLEFIKIAYPALLFLAVDHLWGSLLTFFRNGLYKKISSSRFLRLSIIRQSVVFLAALAFAVLFRRGGVNQIYLLILVVILKSIAEGFILHRQFEEL